MTLNERSLFPGDWIFEGKCAGMNPELFFPGYGGIYATVGTVGGGYTSWQLSEAFSACRACPVRSNCLQYALDNGEEFGIWGGTTEEHRRKMRRAQGLGVQQGELWDGVA